MCARIELIFFFHNNRDNFPVNIHNLYLYFKLKSKQTTPTTQQSLIESSMDKIVWFPLKLIWINYFTSIRCVSTSTVSKNSFCRDSIARTYRCRHFRSHHHFRFSRSVKVSKDGSEQALMFSSCNLVSRSIWDLAF